MKYNYITMFKDYGNNIIVGLDEKEQEEYLNKLLEKFKKSSPIKLRPIILDGKEIMNDLEKILEEKNEAKTKKIDYEKLTKTETNRTILKKEHININDPVFVEKTEAYLTTLILCKMLDKNKTCEELCKGLSNEINNLKESKTINKPTLDLKGITDRLFEEKNIIHHVIIKNAHYIDDYDVHLQINKKMFNSSIGLCINLITKADFLLHHERSENIKKELK